jgi:hypothetical protein
MTLEDRQSLMLETLVGQITGSLAFIMTGWTSCRFEIIHAHAPKVDVKGRERRQ